MIMAQRILGLEEAQRVFREEAIRQGKTADLPDPTPELLRKLERKLSGSVGAATAHAMITQISGGVSISVDDLLAVADETAQIMEYSSQLETQSRELKRTATQLRQANEKLMQLSLQKDGFLSQISHELRTPMTAILSFTEILRDSGSLSAEETARYADIVHDEARSLTRLLDDLLDLSVLENGEVKLNIAPACRRSFEQNSTNRTICECRRPIYNRYPNRARFANAQHRCGSVRTGIFKPHVQCPKIFQP